MNRAALMPVTHCDFVIRPRRAMNSKPSSSQMCNIWRHQLVSHISWIQMIWYFEFTQRFQNPSRSRDFLPIGLWNAPLLRPGSTSWAFVAPRRTRSGPQNTRSPWKESSAREKSLWKMSSSKMILVQRSQIMQRNASLFLTGPWPCRKLSQTLLF